MRIEQILKNASSLPWVNIDSITGHCEQVPSALQDLFVEQGPKQDQAYWKLDNVLVVQGGLFEGAFYITPFLIAGLQATEFNERELIYDLLFEIANGAASIDKYVKYKIVNGDFRYYIPDTDAESVPLSVACRSAVLQGFYRYLNEMERMSTKNKLNMLELISSFIEHPFLIKTTLEKLIASTEYNTIVNRINEISLDLQIKI